VDDRTTETRQQRDMAAQADEEARLDAERKNLEEEQRRKEEEQRKREGSPVLDFFFNFLDFLTDFLPTADMFQAFFGAMWHGFVAVFRFLGMDVIVGAFELIGGLFEAIGAILVAILEALGSF
jgi:hypothetical protein